MYRLTAWCSVVALLFVATPSSIRAERRARTLVVTMTNDSSSNQIKVYDASTHELLQTLATRGKGGVGGNARGVKQHEGSLVAAVNNGSGTVAVFQRYGDTLRFDKLVSTTSAPVSVDFGNDHMYVAGATSADSFVLRRDEIGWMDGTTALELAGGGAPPSGSTAQIGVVNDKQALVTLKTDPDPGTVDIIQLRDGRITGASPTAVSAPEGTLTPFGFSVYRDGTALITLAHSNQDGLFRNGAFASIIAAGQMAPCWTTRVGKYKSSQRTPRAARSAVSSARGTTSSSTHRWPRRSSRGVALRISMRTRGFSRCSTMPLVSHTYRSSRTTSSASCKPTAHRSR